MATSDIKQDANYLCGGWSDAKTIVNLPKEGASGDTVVIEGPTDIRKPNFGDFADCHKCHHNFECMAGVIPDEYIKAGKDTPFDQIRYHLPCVEKGNVQLIRSPFVGFTVMGDNPCSEVVLGDNVSCQLEYDSTKSTWKVIP